MKKLFLSLGAIGLAATLLSFIYNPSHDLVGIWSFAIKDAPEGYNEGNIEFVEKEGILKGKMVTINGTFPMEMLKVSNDSITYDLTVSSNVMQAILVKMKDSLAGKIITPHGDLVITGKREVQ